jgi:hypothetical protein
MYNYAAATEIRSMQKMRGTRVQCNVRAQSQPPHDKCVYRYHLEPSSAKSKLWLANIRTADSAS